MEKNGVMWRTNEFGLPVRDYNALLRTTGEQAFFDNNKTVRQTFWQNTRDFNRRIYVRLAEEALLGMLFLLTVMKFKGER